MSVSSNTAQTVWVAAFGNQTWATDCFGTWIHKDDYGDYNKKRIRPGGDGQLHNYGWDIDHIRPVSDYNKESDADFYNNYEPMHRQNNSLKSDNYPHFSINSRQFKVVTCDICTSHNTKGYGILNITSNQRVDWKAKQNKYFTK
jgi:hypothetical protein